MGMEDHCGRAFGGNIRFSSGIESIFKIAACGVASQLHLALQERSRPCQAGLAQLLHKRCVFQAPACRRSIADECQGLVQHQRHAVEVHLGRIESLLLHRYPFHRLGGSVHHLTLVRSHTDEVRLSRLLHQEDELTGLHYAAISVGVLTRNLTHHQRIGIVVTRSSSATGDIHIVGKAHRIESSGRKHRLDIGLRAQWVGYQFCLYLHPCARGNAPLL